jgi:hypothetical protein
LQPDDYGALSWVSICFCWPIGIFAVCASREVSRAYYRGDFNGAQAASRRARHTALCAIFIGIVFYAFTLGRRKPEPGLAGVSDGVSDGERHLIDIGNTEGGTFLSLALFST